jgi:hypothetical protein
MTVPIPAVASLPQHVQGILAKVVKPKFDAYFAFTSGGTARAIPAPNGEPWFVYPNHTMIPDLVFLWSLFSDVYQAVGGPAPFADFIKADAELLSDVRGIVEGAPPVDQAGSFWHFPSGQIPLNDAIDSQLGDVLKTLRNGFAHSHWYLADLSAVDYWRELGWDIKGADPRFDLGGRPSRNFMMYVADANVRAWDPTNFWALKDLRILVTPSHVLRYHLHLMHNYALNGSRANVFQH